MSLNICEGMVCCARRIVLMVTMIEKPQGLDVRKEMRCHRNVKKDVGIQQRLSLAQSKRVNQRSRRELFQLAEGGTYLRLCVANRAVCKCL